MRRRLSVLLGAMVLAAAMMVALAPPVFAQGEGCYYGQQHAFTSNFVQENYEQAEKHLEKIGDCVTR
jgi:hypothetical protein